MTTRHNDRPAENDPTTLSHRRRRNWRAWCLDELTHGSYGVVPLTSIVDAVADREPDSIDRSIIRTVLAAHILPSLDCEPGIEYDVDRQLLVTYET